MGFHRLSKENLHCSQLFKEEPSEIKKASNHTFVKLVNANTLSFGKFLKFCMQDIVEKPHSNRGVVRKSTASLYLNEPCAMMGVNHNLVLFRRRTNDF